MQKSAAKENIGKSFYLDEQFIGNYRNYRLPSSLRKEFEVSKKPSLMFRPVAAQLLADIEESSQHSADQRKVLHLGAFILFSHSLSSFICYCHQDGMAGVGKSAIICQTAAYFTDKRWLVFPMSSGMIQRIEPIRTNLKVARWLYGEYPFIYNQQTGHYDQPEAAVDALKYFKALNAKSITPKLAEIIDNAVGNPSVAVDGFKRLLDALAESSSSAGGLGSVLLAVDGVNGMHLAETNYRTKDSEPIASQQFTLIRELSRFFTGERTMASFPAH
jgi:hypothetical protein